MESSAVLSKLISSYQKYYDVKKCNEIFESTAEFHSCNEQYFLVKAAKISQFESNEYVFFAQEQNLTAEKLLFLDENAWKTGLSKVKVSSHHRNSDVTLIIVAQTIEPEAKKKIRRLRHYKSYCFSFKGWSSYKIIAYEVSTEKIFANRAGNSLKKLFK